MKYTEAETFSMLRRLIRIYLESYPDDRIELERFLRWSHVQYGYKHDEQDL